MKIKTTLLRIATKHAVYPMLRVEFEDGEVVVLPQMWVESAPRVPIPL